MENGERQGGRHAASPLPPLLKGEGRQGGEAQGQAPTISVIIPVYKAERFMGRCAESLFGQTFESMEFIFVDDATPDRSMEVMREVLGRHPRRQDQVKVLTMDVHRGQAAARKVGVEAATGRYVIHCDADDYVDTDMYRALYEQAAVGAQQPEAGADNPGSGREMVFCDYCLEQDGHRMVCRDNVGGLTQPRQISEAVFAGRIRGGLCWVLAARHLYAAVRHWPEGNVYEDQLILHQLLYACRTPVGWVGRAMYHYVQHPGQTTSKATREQLVYDAQQHALNAAPLMRFLDEAEVPDARYKLVKYQLWDKLRLRRFEGEAGYRALQRSIHPSLTVATVLSTRGLPWKAKRAYLRMVLRMWYPERGERKGESGMRSGSEKAKVQGDAKKCGAGNPKVSVIIPVYNVECYIRRCAESLFGQTLDDIEYIFVNDCSADNSIGVMKEVLGMYPNRSSQVKVVDLPRNCGLKTARREGLKMATGDYIAHCDSDDWVDVDMYRLLWQRAVESGCEMVFCDYQRNQGGKMVPHVENTSPLEDPRRVMQAVGMGKMLGTIWRMIAKRGLYDSVEHWPVADMAEDLVVLPQLLFACPTKVAWVSRPLYTYMQHPNQMTGARSRERLLGGIRQREANAVPFADFYSQTGLPFAHTIVVRFKMHTKNLLSAFESDPDYVALQRALHPELHLLTVLFARGLSSKSKRDYLHMQWRLFVKRMKHN